MKKIFHAMIVLSLLLPGITLADAPTETESDYLGTMTIKSVQWTTEAPTLGDEKLFKVKVDFHYEGELITLWNDYYFSAGCRIIKRKRGGSKYLFWEDRDLSAVDEPEVEGSKDFSETFVFSFSPSEWQTARKRTVDCSVSYSTGDQVKTIVADGVKTNATIRAGINAWRILRTN